jgi:hypothetical protein
VQRDAVAYSPALLRLDLNEEVLIQGVAMEDGGGQSLNITILILRTNKSRPVWWHSMKHAHRFTLPD